MQRVIVTVKRQNEARVRDLEVPAEVESERLSSMIARALRWERNSAGQPLEYEIMAEPPGRVLAPQESLAEAGAWDGSWLVLQPTRRATSPSPAQPTEPTTPSPPTSPPPKASASESPVAGWQPLEIDLPTDEEPEQEDSPQSDEASSETNGFVWKPLE